MKTLTLFDQSDYKAYLLAREQDWPGRGMRKELANEMGCQAAYVSQVLNGNSHFSLEQCEKANALLGHTKNEAHFFLLLVQWARAGTPSLQNYFADQMESLRRQRKKLHNRLGVDPVLGLAEQVTYYSHPYYALVHMAITIPDLQVAQVLENFLKIPHSFLREILEFLTATGLAESSGSRFIPGKARIHLPNNSKLIQSHHRNWRLKALDSVNFADEDDLHYSSVVTLSKEDFTALREQFVGYIEKAKKVIRDSAEEELAILNIDFFTYKR